MSHINYQSLANMDSGSTAHLLLKKGYFTTYDGSKRDQISVALDGSYLNGIARGDAGSLLKNCIHTPDGVENLCSIIHSEKIAA